MYSYYREKFTVDHLSINGLLRKNFEQQDNEIISLILFFLHNCSNNCSNIIAV